MFKAVQARLLWGYLAVLGLVLLVFAVAVYLLFSQSLYAQLDERLAGLAQTVMLSIEEEDGQLAFEDSIQLGATQEQVLLKEGVLVQWLDRQGYPQLSRGEIKLGTIPLVAPSYATQVEPPARVYTVLISDDARRHLGYVRVALTLMPLHQTLNRLLWGLGGGIISALGVSFLGSLWLTRRAMEPIEASFESLKRFTADASHELRSPLTVIKTNTAVALQHLAQFSPQEIHQTFSHIEGATDQMTQLVSDLLLLARIDECQADLTEVDLDTLLGNLVGTLTLPAHQKGINLNYQATAHPSVSGEQGQLLRLFRNLIENAIQYTPPTGQITVALTTLRSQAVISVSDTGIGLAPAHLNQVFERFWRADAARSYQGGTGLGLAIALGIAHNHGGDITVTSQQHQGSCFTVTLPLNDGKLL